MYVFDMELTEWRVCDIKCPKPGFHGAVIMSGKKEDDHLVYAYIRFMCDGVVVNDIPMDVLSVIDDMYGNDEKVHLFQDDYADHYAINVSDILSKCN